MLQPQALRITSSMGRSTSEEYGLFLLIFYKLGSSVHVVRAFYIIASVYTLSFWIS